MIRNVQIVRLAATVIPLGLTISVLSTSETVGQAVVYNAFKLYGVTTICKVPRIAEKAAAAAAAAATVGPGGGEKLTNAEARAAYNCAKPAMASAYAVSGVVAAAEYSSWANYSTSPYVSATHGNRYVNNYANEIGRDYGKYEKGGELPIGTILAKDSFVVNSKGQVMIGVLSLMEKMPVGFNPEFKNWRYTMILPNGKEAGTTGGAGSKAVAFCAGCHGAVDKSVYYVPLGHRFNDIE